MTTTAPEGQEAANLLPHHIEQLHARGLTGPTIRAAGLRSETAASKVAALLGRKTFPAKCLPAIVIPFVTADGRNGYCRVRPDHPRQSGGKPCKYESPSGTPNEIYLPPGVADVLQEASRELIVTEGEFKSLAAMQAGVAAIGLVGVFGWKPKNHESLLPALARVAWKGRRVFIVFDSDVADKPQVQDAENRFAAHLASRGAVVRVVRIPAGPPDKDGKPTKQGLDDYLAAQGDTIRALRLLLDAAEEPQPVDAGAMRQDARQTLDATQEGPAFIERVTQDRVSRLRFWRGTWWYWARGCYRELPPSEVRAKVVEHLMQRYRNLESRHVSNVLDIVKAVAHLSHAIEAPAWLDKQSSPWPAGEILVTRGGMIHLPSLVAGNPDYQRPATPTLFCLSALDYPFAMDTPRPAVWLDFLTQLWPNDADSIGTLQEWFGYVLTQDTRLQKILLLLGPKRSGKGTIGRIVRATIGKENVCGPTLASLATNFGLWPLLGKSLTIISDARLSGRTDSAIVVERLLSISGEDALTIDRKNLEPVTCTLPTRLMLLSNELPRLGDASGALASRMILLRLRESFYGREDHQLTDKLLGELPGILLWAIEGWRRLRERGRFSQPDSALELLGELHDLTSPIGAFLRECCHVGPEFDVPRADLYAAYGAWCQEKGRKHVEDVTGFGRQLRAAVPTLGDGQRRVDGVQLRFYMGVGLR